MLTNKDKDFFKAVFCESPNKEVIYKEIDCSNVDAIILYIRDLLLLDPKNSFYQAADRRLDKILETRFEVALEESNNQVTYVS